jgi:hypothetical protein
MIKSPYTTLKHLNLSHNFIRNNSSIKIRDALEINKTIIKLPIDFNPIKYEIAQSIQKFCQRNFEVDAINQKNKNIYELEQKKQ